MKTILILLTSLISLTSFSQKTKVFLDCSCDKDYLTQEIPFVDFVRDRNYSDVQIKIISSTTANKTKLVDFKFFSTDGTCIQTIRKNLDPQVTKEEERQFNKKYITLGLLPLISNTEEIDHFNINYSPPSEIAENTDQVIDPWKNWNFSVNLGGWANGQSNSQQLNTWSSANIIKTEENWKFKATYSQNNSFSSYVIGDNTIKSKRKSHYASSYLIKGLSDHMSIGLFGSANSSSYSNIEKGISIGPSIEYNLFDYKDFNEKQLRFSYKIQPTINNYYEMTTFNKMDEILYSQNIALYAKFVKKWGNLNSTISANQYLHDSKLYSISFYNSVSWNIFKGLSLNLSGNFSIINDQVSLTRGTLSDAEILLSEKQQSTNFSYWCNAGISYTFGSIYNNIINPRFGN